MKILAIDIGTGTQDVILFDSNLSVENSYKLVLPSPTLMIQRQLHQAARQKKDVVLTGSLMGGGPSGWGVSAHIQQGLKVYATPAAGRSFDDDLDSVRAKGVEIVSESEAAKLPDSVLRVQMRDFDFCNIEKTFALFGIKLDDLAAVAIAVFDHGNAPVDISDRKFRFNYLSRRIHEKNSLSAFAYHSEEIPRALTRLHAVAACARELTCPVVVMDTAPAAVLGATLDPAFARHERNMVVNIGNMHTLGFRLGSAGIEGVFEHHTGFFDQLQLEELLLQFAGGTLTNEEVFNHHGHGALICAQEPLSMEHDDFNLIVTGPKRDVLANSPLLPCFAAPFGDMMLSGCYGLLRATADLLPDLAEPILSALNGKNVTQSPWELD